ncbi:cell wall binding repeat 2 family protein [Clostridium sporogenes]|uniref:cell wall-binding repeat-containing protein n=1 Tax=Clostridium TaxID=1485 RepID=UPI0009096D4F|nr:MULTISPECIES: cell wall-binding repeat-containing protein [Clostridium]APF25925.1 cell wall binding repeat 2 family protein [Clostridium sporogenes]MDI6921842.1 cell wall-binding repeat-containing protein [Clostridium botulinum]WMU98077.1 cell wall-binding repeat-containing protein [Clostridium botulinum]
MNKKGTRALASATVVGLVLATVTTGNVKAAPGDVNKVQGNDRYETAANVAKTNWKDGAENVIIASGNGYADSLSASVLAKKLNAPIILTTAGELNSNAKSALETLKPKNVYVIGGNASVAQSVRDGLKKQYTVTELGGQTRFETNIAVANHLVDKLGVKAENVMVVNGKDGFSDALSAAPVAAAKEQVLLIVGKDASTADLAADFVKKHNSKVTVIGTEGVVPTAVYNKLGASERVNGGADRFDTNLKIMEHFKLNADNIYVANATDGQKGYADALVASALAGKNGAPLVLIDTKDAQGTKNAIKYIQDNKTDKTEVSTVGGKGVMPDEIVNEIETAVNPELSAAEKAVKAYEDAKIGTDKEITAAKALKADAVKAVNNVKDATKKSAFEARIAAKDKAIAEAEAKSEIKVESVKAVNAREIKVVFNREVTEDTAENESNYTVYVGGDKDTNKLGNNEFEAKLQDDNKTVILNLVKENGNKLEISKLIKNKESYKVDIKNVVDTNYKKMKDFTGEYAIFNDKEAPELLKCEYMGSMVKLTFNEPLKENPTVKIDGKTLTDVTANTTEAGEYTVEVKGLKDQNKEYGTHKVEVYNATDYAENSADLMTTEYKATKENEKPVVEKIEEDSENIFKIKFNSAVKDFDNNHKSKLEIKKGNYTFDNDRINIEKDNDEDYGYIVTVRSDDDKNPLYDDDEKEVSLNITVKNFEGMNDVLGSNYTTTLKLTKDDSAPVVKSDSANRVEGKKLVIVFNEDLNEKYGIKKEKIHIKKDNVIKNVSATDDPEVKDNKLYVPIDETLEKGTYTVTLDKGTVKDKSGNENEDINTKVVYDGENESFKLDKDVAGVITVSDNGNKRNKITINFDKKMDDSAVDLKNYKLAGVSLNAISGTTAGFVDKSDQHKVEITLGEGSTDKTENKKIRISKDVKAEDGTYVADKNDNEFVSNDLAFTDDTKPEVEKVEYVKAKDSDKTTNTIKVTFSELVDKNVSDNADLRNDFKIKDGNEKIDVKSVTFKVDPENDDKDKDCAILVLSRSVNIDETNDSTITFKVTDDIDDNKDGIKVVDTSTFKNKLKTTDTIKVKNVTKSPELMSEGNEVIAKEDATKALKDKIASVATAIAGKTEGKAAGNQIEGSEATLTSAKTKAETVLNKAESTSSELNSAKEELDKAIKAYESATVAEISSSLNAPTLSLGGTTTGTITGITLDANETLNVTSATTDTVTVDAANGLSVTGIKEGTSVITVQVVKDGHVIKTGNVTVTVNV